MKKLGIITSIFFSIIFSQGADYAGPDDPAGDIEAEREGYMNGNRVYLYFISRTNASSISHFYIKSNQKLSFRWVFNRDEGDSGITIKWDDMYGKGN